MSLWISTDGSSCPVRGGGVSSVFYRLHLLVWNWSRRFSLTTSSRLFTVLCRYRDFLLHSVSRTGPRRPSGFSEGSLPFTIHSLGTTRCKGDTWERVPVSVDWSSRVVNPWLLTGCDGWHRTREHVLDVRSSDCPGSLDHDSGEGLGFVRRVLGPLTG